MERSESGKLLTKFDAATYACVFCPALGDRKVRENEIRRISIQDGDPTGKNIIIVDDLVQVRSTTHYIHYIHLVILMLLRLVVVLFSLKTRVSIRFD